MANVQTSEVDAKLVPVNTGYAILCADRASKAEQLSIKPFLRRTKNTNVAGSS
jgi:hypothetical protein